MGKKSVKANKSVYQLSREKAGLTREAAAEAMQYISEDRIEKVESGKLAAHPEEILTMSGCYRDPELPNYFCSHECPIGRKYVPEVRLQPISQITLEMLAALNVLEEKRNRLVEITVDGTIHEDEAEDFAMICEKMNGLAQCARALQMWLEKNEMSDRKKKL